MVFDHIWAFSTRSQYSAGAGLPYYTEQKHTRQYLNFSERPQQFLFMICITTLDWWYMQVDISVILRFGRKCLRDAVVVMVVISDKWQ